MKKIRILVDAHVFDYSFQGTTTYIKGLFNSLIKFKDIEITLCGYDIQNLKENFKSEDFRYIQLKSKSKIIRLLSEFPRIIEKGNFDYAHFQYIVPPVKKCKYINTIHDLLFIDYKEYFPWYYRLIKKKMFEYSALKSDIVLTVSEYSKKNIVEKFNINPDKIHVTPNAVNLETVKSKISVKNKYKLRSYILYVSRFEPRKNHLGLLKAYLKLQLYDKGLDLVFIGRHDEKIEKKAYEDVINNIPPHIIDKIHFFDNINDEELAAFYQEASCFIYPSFAEGFGIPPLEAGINECKVLCSNQTAMSDFYFFKYLFNPNDQEEFEYKLNMILLDKDYPYEQIKKSILNNYHWEEISGFFRKIIIADYYNN